VEEAANGVEKHHTGGVVKNLGGKKMASNGRKYLRDQGEGVPLCSAKNQKKRKGSPPRSVGATQICAYNYWSGGSAVAGGPKIEDFQWPAADRESGKNRQGSGGSRRETRLRFPGLSGKEQISTGDLSHRCREKGKPNRLERIVAQRRCAKQPAKGNS